MSCHRTKNTAFTVSQRVVHSQALVYLSEGPAEDRMFSLPAKSFIKNCTWNLQEHTTGLLLYIETLPSKTLTQCICTAAQVLYWLWLWSHCTGLVVPMWTNYSDCNMDISFNRKQFYSECVKYMQASALAWHAKWSRILILLNTMTLWGKVYSSFKWNFILLSSMLTTFFYLLNILM